MRIECQKNVGMRHTKRTKRLVTKSKAFPAAKASEASQVLRLLSLFKDLALGGMVEQDGALLLAFCDAGFLKFKTFFTWCLMLCIHVKESWYYFQIL